MKKDKLENFILSPIPAIVKFLSPFLIAGEKAHFRYFSEDAYKAAAGQRELVIIPHATHVDLYDRLDVIPFDKRSAFFTQHLHGHKQILVVTCARFWYVDTDELLLIILS